MQVIVDPIGQTVASIAAVHNCGGVFIQRSRSKPVAGIVPCLAGIPLSKGTIALRSPSCFGWLAISAAPLNLWRELRESRKNDEKSRCTNLRTKDGQARRLVVSPHREAGQVQFIDHPVGEQASPWLSQLLEWSHVRLHHPISVAQLANRACVSKRTLDRRLALVQWTGLRLCV